MKKGFTLIELLAVIVILAIIAVIAVPIVLNIINDVKESAVLRSADFYLDGVEKSIATSILKGISIKDGKYSIMEDGNVCIGTLESNTCTGDILKVEMDGEMPTEGTIKIKDGQIQKVNLTISDKEIWTDPFIGELAYKLPAGLYDENDKLLASWDELVEKYDLKNLIENGYDYEREENAATTIESNYSNAHKLIIDDSVTSIGEGAFSSGKNLKEVIINEGVTNIDYSFQENFSITKIVIPSTVTSMDIAFNSCPNLTTVIIEEGVTSIGEMAFAYNESLTSITIPSSVTSIGALAFAQCTSLASITIPSSVTSIGSSAFSGCESLTSITIPNGVTSIEDYAFSGCMSLTSITIPSSVTSIGGGAFVGSGLTSITIPSSVTTIESEAFYLCTSLKSITIPSSVTSIGHSAFGDCTGLTTIYYKGNAEGEPWGAENATVVRNF